MRGSKMRAFLVFLIALVAILHFSNQIEWHESTKDIPRVSQGQATLFDGEMGKGMLITSIDATKEYIYVAYASPGVVAVYDWEGTYQYSIAFYSDTNGTLRMRCKDGLLFVHDYAGFELVFSGREQLSVLPPSEVSHAVVWFTSERDIPLVIRNGMLYEDSGRFIMHLPGRLE